MSEMIADFGDDGLSKKVVLPPFCTSEAVLMELCVKGHMGAYLKLWDKYYDLASQSGVVSELVGEKVVVGQVNRGKDVIGCQSPVRDQSDGLTTEGSVSDESDVVVTSGFAKRQMAVLGSTKSGEKKKKKPAEPASADTKTPWRSGKLVRTLSDQQIASYGEGACYLHLVRAEKAADVFRKHGAWLDLAGFLSIPTDYLIPRADMRDKAITVLKKSIHISGVYSSGWSFLTVLQAAVLHGMKAPLLRGLEPGYGDLRIDGTFKLGGMALGVAEIPGQQVNKVEVLRTTSSSVGSLTWSFDEKKSTVVVQMLAMGSKVEDVVVEREGNTLRVGVSPTTTVDLLFPFSLTKQVVAWEIVGRMMKRLVVSISGVLVESVFFPYAPTSRVVARENAVAVHAIDAESDEINRCETIVVDSLECAKELFEKGYDDVKVVVYGAVQPSESICYWPSLVDKSEVKARLRALYDLATGAFYVVGGLVGMEFLSGVPPSVSSRYHRWYELQLAGAVSLADFSKVLVQSDQGYEEAARMFKEEIDAGSLCVEKYQSGVDTRMHTVCAYIEAGAVMSSSIIREFWCGEAREYICLSPTAQPFDWLY